MNVTVIFAICCAISAGIVNGSFALPTKHRTRWDFEHIWLGFALWAFVLIPWVSIFALDPKVMVVYQMTPLYTWLILLIGGLLFGTGQVCFALSLRSIGFGLGFVITIGLGTALGFLLPLLCLHIEQLLRPVGLVTLFATVLIGVGLYLSYCAGRQRNRAAPRSPRNGVSHDRYVRGVWLAACCGLFSALQNFTFALTGNLQQLALASGAQSLAAANIIWPPFLLCAFIPYAGYMLHLHGKNQSFGYYQRVNVLSLLCLTFIMGLFWYGSLTLYSQSSLIIGALGPVITWPLFMVFIILTANFWSWRYREWAGCGTQTKRMVAFSIAALVAAVLMLSYSALLSG